MATENITPSPRVRPHKKKPPIARWQAKNNQERAEKAVALEAARQIPPQDAIVLLRTPAKIRQTKIVAHCTVPGNPGVKQRPRFAKASGAIFTPRATKESEREIGWHIKSAMQELVPDNTSAFGIRIAFYVHNAQRKDIDNMAKLVFDAITGIAWVDDSQVKEMFAWVFTDEAHPRTEILVYRLGYDAIKTQICEACHKRFRVYPSWEGRPYCSRKCAAFAQRNRVTMMCAHCGIIMERIASLSNKYREYFCSVACKQLHHSAELTCVFCQTIFRRANSLIHHGQNAYCSALCRDQHWNTQKKSPAAGICIACGGSVTRKKYKYCVGCRSLACKQFQLRRVAHALEAVEVSGS